MTHTCQDAAKVGLQISVHDERIAPTSLHIAYKLPSNAYLVTAEGKGQQVISLDKDAVAR